MPHAICHCRRPGHRFLKTKHKNIGFSSLGYNEEPAAQFGEQYLFKCLPFVTPCGTRSALLWFASDMSRYADKREPELNKEDARRSRRSARCERRPRCGAESCRSTAADAQRS